MSLDSQVSFSSRLRMAAATATLVVTAACSGTPEVSSLPTPKPTVLTWPPEANPQQDAFEAQLTSVAPLTTPGAVDVAMRATAQAFEWEELVARGFPEKPIFSTARIDLYGKDAGSSGSGAVFNYGDFRVIVSAGHLSSGPGNPLNDDPVQKMYVSRGGELPNSGTEQYQRDEFGMFASFDLGLDLMIIVVRSKTQILGRDNIYRGAPSLDSESIYFGKEVVNGSFYGVCFPGSTDRMSTVYDGARLPNYTKQEYGPTFLLDRAFSSPGSSGCGVWVVAPGETESKFVGVTVEITQEELDSYSYLAGTSYVTNVSKMGETTFMSFVQRAIDDLNSRTH